MKVAVETVDPVRRRLAVEVPVEQVRAEFDRAYQGLRRHARVRGFRPGRAPQGVLERVYGDQVRAEVFGKLIESSFREALQQEHLHPLGQPEIVTESAERDAPLRYSATVEVPPELERVTVEGLRVERPSAAVSDADVEQALEEFRQSRAEVTPIEDRTVAAAGDLARVDYEAREDERVLGSAKDRIVEVGGEVPETMGAHLVGVAVGEPAAFEIRYPEDFEEAQLAGRTVAFSVTVTGLLRREVPALDDAFAQQHEAESVEALRAQAREQLAASRTRQAEQAVRSAVVRQLVEANAIPVPDSLAAQRTEALVEEFLDSLGPRRPPRSQEGEFRRQLAAELAPRAREQVAASLLLDAAARQEGVTVSDADVEAQVEAMAQHAGEGAARLRAAYAEPELREHLRAQLRRERALDAVVARADIAPAEA